MSFISRVFFHATICAAVALGEDSANDAAVGNGAAEFIAFLSLRATVPVYTWVDQISAASDPSHVPSVDHVLHFMCIKNPQPCEFLRVAAQLFWDGDELNPHSTSHRGG